VSYGGVFGGSFGGGSAYPTTPTAPSTGTWDIFAIDPSAIESLDALPESILIDPGGAFSSGPGYFTMCSGGVYDTGTAQIIMDVPVTESFTAEWTFTPNSLPDDFGNVAEDHLYLGAFSAASNMAGVFISKVGIAFTGSILYSGGVIIPGYSLATIPGSSVYVTEGVRTTVRIIVDDVLGLTYLYVTRADVIPYTGHVLVGIFPVLSTAEASPPPAQDQVVTSVRGLNGQVCCSLHEWNLSSRVLISDIAPVADAGEDQASQACSIIRLDGSASYDLEGKELSYEWRLVDAPLGSIFAFEGFDGATTPDTPPTGYTNIFYSTELGAEHASSPIAVGDVLVVGGVAYTISAVLGGPFRVQVAQYQIPDSLSGAPFKILRQQGISGPTLVNPGFYPDKTGFFLFDLMVYDGRNYSTPTGLNRAKVLINVVESPLPRGVTHDASFIFDNLMSFWSLVEDKDKIGTLWTGMSEVVASELYTLWQYEYNKSHRDIQRTINRRWLHYDLMLPEPIPDLTRLRYTWGGISSDVMSASGVAGLAGGTIEVSSPLLDEPVVIEFKQQGTVTPEKIALELQNRLQSQVDSRFSVVLLEDLGSGDITLRVDAPLSFTFTSDSTSTVFTYPKRNGMPTGTGGSREDDNVYKVGVSLQDVDIAENDYLVVDGVAHRIQKITSDPADDFAFQRVVVKDTLPDPSSASWTISGFVKSGLINFYAGLVDDQDVVEFEVVGQTTGANPNEQERRFVTTTALGACAGQVSRLAIDTDELVQQLTDESSKIRMSRVIRRHYVPVDERVVDVPILQERIVLETDEDRQAALRRNMDFFIEEVRGRNAIRFAAGFSGDLGDVWEGDRPPDRLWAEYTYLDNSENIENNFGKVVGLTRDQAEVLGVDYVSAVRGLWYVLFNGPSVRRLRIGVQIHLGLPFAEETGVIEEIRDDFLSGQARILIRDTANPEIVRSYTYPSSLGLEVNPETNAVYAVGDEVEEFSPLVEGAEIVDYVKDPTWFEGILNQGVFYEVQKFHTFLVRVDKEAFSLDALVAAQDFVERVKPKYIDSLYFVVLDLNEEDIELTEDVLNQVTLSLSDTFCNAQGGSTHFDQPEPAGGGWENAFDTDGDGNAPPVSPVLWGFDKDWLCPSMDVLLRLTDDYSGSETPEYDSVFAYDTGYSEEIAYQDTSVTSVPLAGVTLTPTSGNAAGFAGILSKISIVFLGDPGSDPTDYEVSVQINSVQQDVEAFTDGVNTELIFSTTVTVSATDTVDLIVRPASGASARSPNWSKVIAVVVNEGPDWQHDMGYTHPSYGAGPTTIPAGTYTIERVLYA